METLRYEHKYAKRNHKAICEITGLSIETGDRYFEGAWRDGMGFSHIKALSVIQEMIVCGLDGDETWSPGDGNECLLWWLRDNLGQPTYRRDEVHVYCGKVEHPDVEACYQAAMAFWWPKKSSSE